MKDRGERAHGAGCALANARRTSPRGALLPLVCLVLLLAACGREARPPRNLVLISLDTLRRDHLSTYGYRRPTSPNLDRLASESVVFERAFTHATNTAASHLTLFTGVLPDRHHVWTNGIAFDGSVPTLATLLHAAGLRTAGFVSGLTMQRPANLAVGFESWDDAFTGGRRDGSITVAHALEWLAGEPAKSPYFLFVHLFDVHGPYRPHRRAVPRFISPTSGPPLARIPSYQRQKLRDGTYAQGRNDYVDRYDTVVAYEDQLVGRLLAGVDLESTVVAVIADHGESLDERYWNLDHGGTVYDEELRVPLIVRVPGFEPRRVQGMVGLADVMPTLLELLGAPASPSLRLEGSSLVPALRGEREPTRSEVVSYAQVHPERLPPGYDLDTGRAILGLRAARFKVVLLPGKTEDVVELYDLEADPRERRNVARRQPELRDRMLARLATLVDPRQRRKAGAADRELEEQLKSLGYVGD